MDVVVDAEWTGDDEPGLWEDWTDGFNSPTISRVQEIDVPNELFDDWEQDDDDDENKFEEVGGGVGALPEIKEVPISYIVFQIVAVVVR